jgi:hypothetical protein
MKVAGIFAARSRATAPTTAEPQPQEAHEREDSTFESLLRVKLDADTPRPRFILAAAEKAAERKALAEALKAKRIEREIARLERANGPYIRFDTTTDTGTLEGADSQTTADSDVPAAPPADKIDLAAMRRRYLERLESKDILKLRATPAQLELIVNWVGLASEGRVNTV